MKRTMRFIRMLWVATLLVLAFALFALSAQAQTYRTYNMVSNVVTVAATGSAGSVSNIVNAVPNIRMPYSGVAFQLTFAGSDAGATGATNVGFGIALSVDGTNYMTNDLIWMERKLNGAAAYRGRTNFPTGTFGPAKYMKLISVTNGHNTPFTLSNLFAGGFYVP